MNVRDEQNIYFETHLQLVNILSLFVQQEGGDIDRYLCMDSPRAFFHCLLLNDAEYVQRRGGGITNVAKTVTTRAGDVARLRKGGLQTLTR